VVTRTFDARLVKSIGYAPDLGRALLSGDHDVLHQHGLWQYLSVQSIAWRAKTGRPVIVSPHGMLDPWALCHSGWKKEIARFFFEDRNLKGAACLQALNESELASIRALGLKNPVAVIPNGVDLPDTADWPKRPNFYPSDRRTLLFLGRLHQKKGVSELIEAWARLKAAAPKLIAGWHLVLAGWDDRGFRAQLEERVVRDALSSDITMPGPLYGLAKTAALAHADAFILPSYSEGLPVAVLEAWAYGLPVFMTASCNLPEGFAAEAAVEITTTPENIASTLASHLGDQHLPDLGRNGRALVAERFTWQRIVRLQSDIYRWLATGGPAPPNVHTGDRR
jgi:poly(glycerol-phosphate) alpha-glucosyltransferase